MFEIQGKVITSTIGLARTSCLLGDEEADSVMRFLPLYSQLSSLQCLELESPNALGYILNSLHF